MKVSRSVCYFGLISAVLLGVVACSGAEDSSEDHQTAPSGEEWARVEQAVVSSKVIGTWCADTPYQVTQAKNPPAPWIAPPSCVQADALASNFTSVTRLFAHNLVANAVVNLEASGDHLTNEKVDLALFEGHSGYDAAVGVGFAVHEAQSNAWSTNMAFGHTAPNQRGLSIFASYSCNTVDHDGYPGFGNGSWLQDWAPAFNPGLRLHLGSNRVSHFTSSGVVGKKFAQELVAGRTFKQGWATAWDQVGANTHAAFVASGSTYSDCVDRILTMTWANFDSKPRRVNPAWLCAITQTL